MTLRLRLRHALLLVLIGVLLTACSGIPGSGPVQDVTKVADQVNQDAPATPDAGMTADAIVRGFISSAARISLAGAAGSAMAAVARFCSLGMIAGVRLVDGGVAAGP